ncbi:MAG: heparinase II/III family protein [candidate division KSB1 bacterium]|nr:heparinase II/III family protein [candidate division KSB1 bacterium]
MVQTRKAVAVALILSAWVVQPSLALARSGQPSAAPTPRTTYRELFGALDLGRPELLAVKEAVATGDTQRAVAALAQYLRERSKPLWFSSPLPGEGESYETGADLIQAAEAILNHRLRSVGIEHPFGEQIDWHYNPTYEPTSPYPPDNEWTWQLNRHRFWRTLAEAYQRTGDERYAREFVAQMVHWVRSCPVPQGAADQRPFSAWRTIEAGLRMAYAWPDAFFAFLRSPSFPDEALVTMLTSILEHARYLRTFPTRGNWLTMEMDGLFCVGVLFPEFREAEEWRHFALETLLREMSAQVYPDGAQFELTPGYHDVALRNFLRPLYLARLNGIELEPSYLSGLERMFAFLMWIMTPDRSVPRFNDAWDVDVVARMRQAEQLFPERGDFRWIASGCTSGSQPDGLSHLFPYAGIAVLRSSWDRDANYLAIDCGPFGFGHQHEDKLSFVLYLRGISFVQDAGSYAYDASKWRRYVLSAHGHNVMFVDGAGQHRRGQPRESYVVSGPVPVLWRTTPAFDYVEAAYGGPLEPYENAKPARHTRRVVYFRAHDPRDDFWLVLDAAESFDDRRHRYTSIFHLDAPEAKLSSRNRTLEVSKSGVTLEMRWPKTRALDVYLVQGQEEPEVQGWLPTGHGRRGVRSIPVPHFECSGKGRAQLAYAFCSKDSAGSRVREIEWASRPADLRRPALRVRLRDGSEVTIRWSIGPSPPWETGDWPRSDSVIAVCRSADGKVSRIRLWPE